jgi:hypothetical protein
MQESHSDPELEALKAYLKSMEVEPHTVLDIVRAINSMQTRHVEGRIVVHVTERRISVQDNSPRSNPSVPNTHEE